MFAIDHVLVSDALLDAPFACHLGSCFGACCVHGDRGAPLEPDEREAIEDALPVVEAKLRPEARREIARRGVWEGDARDGYATTTVNDRECVFVVYDRMGGREVAKCALQQAFWAGKLGFEKPLSCHLYPIRVERYGEGADAVEVLNYERIELCEPAVPHGARTGVQLADFLERPLTRRYGADWFARFRETLRQRRLDVGVGPQDAGPSADGAPSNTAPAL
jgi:hypothetical protein